jgi:hypothetical protein
VHLVFIVHALCNMPTPIHRCVDLLRMCGRTSLQLWLTPPFRFSFVYNTLSTYYNFREQERRKIHFIHLPGASAYACADTNVTSREASKETWNRDDETGTMI